MLKSLNKVAKLALDSVNYVIRDTGYYLVYNGNYRNIYTNETWATLDEAFEALSQKPEINSKLK